MPTVKGKPSPKGTGAKKPTPRRKALPKSLRAAPTPRVPASHRDKMAERSRASSAKAREVGLPDPPQDPRRRESCRLSFRRFCETYLAEWFPLAWGSDHLKAIAKIEAAVLHGERFAFAMPRSAGKTTLCEAAAIWSLLYGHRRFVVVIGAEAEHATEILGEIMEELEVNELLFEDFNEVCRYIEALEGIAQRANGQTANGVRTRIEWTEKKVRLPTIPGSVSSASLIKVAGITGRIRGMKIAGKRPDLVIVDDPQTDDSATSISQNRSRLRAVAKAILGLAGPKKSIAALMPCTVIAPGDMVDRVLDRAKFPKWQGERFKMVYRFPDRMDLWNQYAELQRDGFEAGDKGAAATAFYREHRRQMDTGCEVSWPARFPEEKVSAIQHAMDLFFDDRLAFLAECQNEPEFELAEGEVVELTSELLAGKLNQLPRALVPAGCTRLTAGIDVQKEVLFAVVVAWDEKFGGAVIDYLAFPKQNRPFFAANDPRPKLSDIYPGLAEEAVIYSGLKALTAGILSRGYEQQTSGQLLRVELALVDSGDWTDTIYQFCKLSPFAAMLKPSKGRGIRAADKPMAEWRTTDPKRDVVGWNWRIDADSPHKHVLIDVNSWKSFVAGRLAANPATTGSLMLPGTDPVEHDLLISHLTGEYQTETFGRGRIVREWRKRPGAENHWWDALVLAAVAANVRGLKWDAASAAGDHLVEPARLKVALADLVAAHRAGRRGRGSAPAGPPRLDSSSENLSTPPRRLAELVAAKRSRRGS